METLSPFQYKLLDCVDGLNVADRDRVLAFAEALRATKPRPRGVPGKAFVELIRSLNISKEDVEEMERAIEEGCERVDPNGW
jgi:hypothetical protein